MQQALLSSLLIAVLFAAPYLQTVRADEEVASSTEAVASSTTETVPEEVATSTDTPVTDDLASSTKEEPVAEETTSDDPTSGVGEAVASVSSASARTYSTYSDKPVFLTEEMYFPNHALRFGPRFQKTVALKDGTRTYLTVLINQAPTTVSITADISALGGSNAYPLQDVYDYVHIETGTHTIHQFQSDWFTVQSGGANGTVSIPITATDENGDVLTSSITVTLDNTPPTLTIDSISRTATSSLAQDDLLYFSGSLDGTGTETKPYLVYVYELASDGETVIGSAAQDANHPSSLELFALRGGSFSNVPLQIYTIEGTDAFPDDVAYLQYVFSIDDGAGNLITATSSLVSVLPTPPEPEGPKISNVLFLPGIKGSRLYDTDGNKLWEPGSDQDVEKLFLTSTGVSANSGVHTRSGDIIETIAGFSEVYGSFIRSMSELQSAKKIKEWRIVSYDWRLSLDDIVNKGAVREDNIYYDEIADVPYLQQNLLELASSSPTHKVTIIAHSNGGLVAKALLQKLGYAETASLIDKVIFVAVPQSGAPQALGALLFGYKEALPSWFPFMVHVSTARTFAENSPMGYHLLPSQRYFDDVIDPEHAVVQFTAASTYAEERAKYGNTINTWEELRAYSLAEDKGRDKPDPVLFFKPNILNDSLLTYAKSTHDSLDVWVPPTGVTLYQIGGWGVDTVSGIEFYELCVLSVCKKEYRPTFVIDGDGVVPVQSALMVSETTNSIKKFWVNLKLYGFGPISNKNHGNILSVADVQHFLNNIILGDSSLPDNIYTTQPTETVATKQLRFMLHSPLTLNLYDASGNHTGPTTDGDSEETIPGSVYGQFGEVQYVTVPAGPEYSVEMNGVASGTFSLDIQEVSGGSVVASTTLASVPTQAGTIARMTISDTLATVSSLSVDSDGNGSADLVLPVSQNSTTFYQAPVEAVAESASSGGSSRGSKISPISETASINIVPPSALPTTPIALQPTKKGAQVAEANRKEPTVLTQITNKAPLANKSSQLASPLWAFNEVKDILISMLVGVYHFFIRIGSFLFTR